MRRWITGVLTGCLCVSLCSCGTAQAAESIPSDSQPPAIQQPTSDVEPQSLVSYPVYEDIHPYTGLPKGEDYPEGRRGVAVMINNVRQSWPQSGLNSADLVYEVVAESGITRLMAVYRDYAAMPTVGPVRSARDQHIQLMLPLQTLFAHIGSSTTAQEYLDRYHYTDTRAIDGKYKSFYWVDEERLERLGQEHCVYTNGEYFSQAVEEYGLQSQTQQEPPPVFDFVRWDQPARTLTGGDAQTVEVRFSSYVQTELRYDEESGRYLKWEYGQPQLDAADGGAQYGADNVFILFVSIEKYPDGVLSKVHFDQRQGAGLYLSGGRYQRVRWIKEDPASPLRIVDNEGRETDVKVNPGTSYIAVVGTDQIENCWLDGQSLADAFGENA